MPWPSSVSGCISIIFAQQQLGAAVSPSSFNDDAGLKKTTSSMTYNPARLWLSRCSHLACLLALGIIACLRPRCSSPDGINQSFCERRERNRSPAVGDAFEQVKKVWRQERGQLPS